jgi:hypothetical protein
MKLLLFTCRYLQERRKEWQKKAEQSVLDAPDPACPLGHVPLPDSERTETLNMLRKSKEAQTEVTQRSTAWDM